MTILVKQRSGRRWVVVGSFASETSDSLTLKEELRAWLWNQGILNPDLRKWTAKVAKP